jgi:Predicted integral membrane protein
MKYKCDVIRDLMPLCVDDAATEDSKHVVVEHISECKDCEKFYKKMIQEIPIENELSEENKGYVAIAKKLRKRKLITRIIIVFIFWACFELMINYAGGYRFTPQSAATLSHKLNESSHKIGGYDWGEWQFYIYDSANSYEVVTVNKHWNGWKANDNWLVWPKYLKDRGGIINAGDMYFWSDTNNKCGIQLFPVIAEDPAVTNIEISVFGKTKKADIKTNELAILTFENKEAKRFPNDAKGFAYDKDGKLLYQLKMSEDTMRWVWEKAVK